ncbi:4-hydroxy-tetrahydrodipicolinate synthase [Blattabacterium cuenoti]|uniref:4-hydroxy-tetrahydrodipicolinate synthase n=1 Tax=Blattabacterium cuenoti TaxID=1653831 RepID=UPI00163C793A|nr:4-hydroxy-tetrahydrodipicolinate synthase [Blattabacterium cuenoti]
MKKKLCGTGVALITPFKKNGDVDFNGLENIIKYVLNSNINYLVALGTTSESSTLYKEEKRDIIECIQYFNLKKLPLVLGIGGNDTVNVIDQINYMKNLFKFYCILSVSPYYNMPSQNGIYNHFKSIIDNTNIKIIIYNVPKRTGSNINTKTVIKLSNDFKDNIIGIKEASGNLLQSYNIIKQKSDNFSLISGDDFINIPIILGGGESIISVIAQGFPKQVSNMIDLAKKNDVKKSFSIFYKILDIIYLIYKEGNPTGIKTLLNIMNMCEPYVRLPLSIGTYSLRNEMKNCLNNINNL